MSSWSSQAPLLVAGAAAAAVFGYLIWDMRRQEKDEAEPEEGKRRPKPSDERPAQAADDEKRLPFTHKKLHQFNRIFRKLDKNNNGHLDEYEVRHLAKLLYVPSDAEVAATVAKFDQNKDSKISFDEFITRLTVIPATDKQHRDSKIELNEHDIAELKLQFDEIDLDGDGFVDTKEAIDLARDSYVPPQATVDAIMRQLDVDKNKVISLEEFLQYMARALTRLQSDPMQKSVSRLVDEYEDREAREKASKIKSPAKPAASAAASS